jgi:UDP-3-O-[3-hydroxymyristoyl] glucosamine N-acyltransferase
MDYVAFKKPLALSELVTVLNKCGEPFKLASESLNTGCIVGVSDGRTPCANTICFVEKSDIQVTEQVVYIAAAELPNAVSLVTDDPRSLFIKFLDMARRENLLAALPYGVAATHESCDIQPHAIIEDNVAIGQGTVISNGCVLKSGTIIGANCIIRENTVIGCEGIALYKNKQNMALRFPHVSGVVIGDNVEIGANVVIVKGTLKPTIIDTGSVIGNLCNIGHGVRIGKKVWISVGTLVGGNTTIGGMATIGLGVRFRDNLTIGENASVGMGSVVTKDIEQGGSVFGNPAKKIRTLNTGPAR